MANQPPRFAFAGDRDIAVDVLAHLLEQGDRPLALLLSDEGAASHDAALTELCALAGLAPPVLRARRLNEPALLRLLLELKLDYILCVHFPHILRRPLLDAARSGVLNLHPAYLPYNRGWHTPSWMILEGTPAGASLHYMSEGLDAGDVVHQEEIAVDPSDTAHTLYRKLKALELTVFQHGWRRVKEGGGGGVPQRGEKATAHRRQDLFHPAVQRLELDEMVCTAALLRRLRALTTNRLDEAAYFESDGRRYRVQVTITPDEPNLPLTA